MSEQELEQILKRILNQPWHDSLRLSQEINATEQGKQQSSKSIAQSLFFPVKILIRIGIVLSGFETLLLEKFWTMFWKSYKKDSRNRNAQKLKLDPDRRFDRICQFRIPTDLVIFLWRSSTNVAITPNRILASGSGRDFDKNLMKYSQNPVCYSCQDRD